MVNNLATVTCNKHNYTPFAINGKPMKSVNQYYTWGVGVCETPYGTMVCCECPKCGDRIRFHIADLSYLTLYHDEWKII